MVVGLDIQVTGMKSVDLDFMGSIQWTTPKPEKNGYPIFDKRVLQLEHRKFRSAKAEPNPICDHT